MDPVEELLTRGVANIIPGKDEIQRVLESGEKLNIYLGIDPTSTQIHLGHAVSLRKLQAFADLGHHVTLLIGDFTALVGDTSDKDSERPILTSEEITQNFKTYKEQAEKIIDFNKVTLKHNSEWLKPLTFAELIQLTQKFSLNDFISRELIKKRLAERKHIRLDEVMYPLMQGYDSYMMDTDIQIGGTDQTFNMQAGRHLQKQLRNKESFVLSTAFLEGTDGRKMSKSWGNAIWLTDSPQDMYGKVMSLNDNLIGPYFLLGTNVSMETVQVIEKRLADGENPMTLKKELAYEIVKELHSENAAQEAAHYFESVFQNDQTPEDIQTITVSFESTLLDVLVEEGIIPSKSEAKRLVDQKGIHIDGVPVHDYSHPVEPNSIVSIGKRKFVKIELK